MLNSEEIDPKVVRLLSQIIDKELDPRDVNFSVVFLAALISVLLGVMLADKTISNEEKQRWQKTVNRFVPAKGNVRELVQAFSKGIRSRKIYKNLSALQLLTASFSNSQKLLLIGLGYEMSFADGSVDELERQYLRSVSNHLSIKTNYLKVLEDGFSRATELKVSALHEVRSLLDPAHFHGLDPLFLSAASDLLDTLPVSISGPKAARECISNYAQLAKLQEARKELCALHSQLYRVFQECADRRFVPSIILYDLEKISRKLQSQKFRLAILGEFSQGKSTLLNALLGEKIQPVRAIPCSGTVSVLKYGENKRVICCYKDGRQEEIPIEQYKEFAAIPREAAKGEEICETLAQGEIRELIFEHPGLELCQYGVEVIDSPGLNEHPDRTAITHRLIQDTDAAIFLANATRPLTQSERQLLQDLKSQLSGSDVQKPAQNLFVVVNFIDLLEDEEDRKDVQQRFDNFLKGEDPLISGENRIHFISAKAALNAKIENQSDEYFNTFRQFTQAIEHFLTSERGYLEIEQASSQIQHLTQLGLLELEQVESSLNLSEAKRKQILEQIGEVSGRYLKIKLFAQELMKEVVELTSKAFEDWYPTPSEDEDTEVSDWEQGLRARIIALSQSWHSEHSHLWSQKQLITDYANQFASAMQKEIDKWANDELKAKILDPAIKKLEEKIIEELAASQHSSLSLPDEIGAKFSNQLKLIIGGIDDGISGAGGLIGGGAAGVALAAGLYAFTFVAIIPIIIAGTAAAIVSSFGLGLLDIDGIHDKIKIEVIAKGFEKFNESSDKVLEKIDEFIYKTFESRLEVADQAVQKIIACYENALQANEQISHFYLDQAASNKVLIAEKCQELKQIQKKIEGIVVGLSS